MAGAIRIAGATASRAQSISSRRILTKPSVITLGGLFSSSHQLLPIHVSLWRSGQFRVFPIQYDGFNYSIEQNGSALAKLIERRLHSAESPQGTTEASKLHFVTHSYGALVLRSAMQQIGWDGFGSRTVMIAPCNRGSVLARRFAGMNCASVFLGSLAAAELGQNNEEYFDELGDMPRLAKVRVIAGTGGYNPMLPSGIQNDGRVLVPETRLRTPHDHVTVSSTHGFMLYRPAVIRATRRFIQGTAKGLDAWRCKPRRQLSDLDLDHDDISDDRHGSTDRGRQRRAGAGTDNTEDDSDDDFDGSTSSAVDAVADAVRVGVGGEALRVDDDDRKRASERVTRRRRDRGETTKVDCCNIEGLERGRDSYDGFEWTAVGSRPLGQVAAPALEAVDLNPESKWQRWSSRVGQPKLAPMFDSGAPQGITAER